MQLSRRHLGPNELDHELVWLSVSIVSLGLAAAWLWLGLPWPQCLFHSFTSLPCLTCGMTRAAIQFFHGHLFAAWKWNPLVFVALCGLSIFDAYAFIVLVTRAPRLRIVNLSRLERNGVRALIVGLLALNWVYLLSHWRSF